MTDSEFIATLHSINQLSDSDNDEQEEMQYVNDEDVSDDLFDDEA